MQTKVSIATAPISFRTRFGMLIKTPGWDRPAFPDGRLARPNSTVAEAALVVSERGADFKAEIVQ